MSWLDIIILILLAVPTLIGLKVGIIKAVLSMAGVIVGVILAGRFYVSFADTLTFMGRVYDFHGDLSSIGLRGRHVPDCPHRTVLLPRIPIETRPGTVAARFQNRAAGAFVRHYRCPMRQKPL